MAAPDSDGEVLAMREAAVQHHNELVSAHASEAIDAVWASEKTGEITSRLTGIGVTGGGLQVNCRTSYCVVDGQWPAEGGDSLRTALADVMTREEPCEFHFFDKSIFASGKGFIIVVRCKR